MVRSWLRRCWKSTFACGKSLGRKTSLGIEMLEERIVPADWSGVLPGGTVWDNTEVHCVVGDVSVPAGALLTIAPGAIVKFDSGLRLTVAGTLNAAGASNQPIVFTSVNDDSVGGDTNGDGDSSGSPGDWNNIAFTATSTGSVLDHVEVRNGGHFTVPGQVVVNHGQLTLTNSVLSDSFQPALRIEGGAPTVQGNTFRNNNTIDYGAAISMDLASNPVLVGNVFVNNRVNGVFLDGGILPHDATWDDPDVVYQLAGDVTVPAGVTLTVVAGQIVKSADELLVEGTLHAVGTASQPVIFTSLADDTAGGDTNNDAGGSAAFAGDWAGIEFVPGATASVLDHAEVRYAGGNRSATSSPLAAVLVDRAELSLTNSVIHASASIGLRIEDSTPVIRGNTIRDSDLSTRTRGYAISVDLVSHPTVVANTFVNNVMNGVVLDNGTLPGDTTWDILGAVYVLNGPITVPEGTTLTLAPGVAIKGIDSRQTNQQSGDLLVHGTLHAQGTAAQPIILTDSTDDRTGGDTDNNGVGFRGSWAGIRLNPTSTANVLDHVEIRRADAGRSGEFGAPAVLVDRAPLTLTNSVIRDGSTGLRIQHSNPVVTGVTFENNFANAGSINMDLASNPDVQAVRFFNNFWNGLVVGGWVVGEETVLPGDTVWNDTDVVYILGTIGAPLTIPAGRTLMIGAGQVIKIPTGDFGGNPAGFVVEGTLLANGTTTAPIIFTSSRDDSAGGDTDNQTDFVVARGWRGLEFTPTSTGSVLDHIDLRYASDGGDDNASLSVVGASLILRNSVIRDSIFKPAVHAVANASVELTSNRLVRNPLGLMVESGAVVTAVNNTIDEATPNRATGGVWVDSAIATLTNNLITNYQGFGVRASGSAVVTLRHNDVFTPVGTLYDGLPDQTGQNGNVSVDPLYFNNEALQYQLRPQSPVLDAGTSTDAPTTDARGNPRFDDPRIPNSGGGTSPFVDLGALERQEVNTSDVDLTTISVLGEATEGVPDQLVGVNWTVRNLGSGTAIGPWVDALYLSRDRVWSPDDVLLDQFQIADALGPGQSYTARTLTTLPAVLPGNYYFIVRANALNEVFEAGNLVNNSGASTSTIGLDLLPLVLDEPRSDVLRTAGTARVFKLTLPAGADLALALSGPLGAVNELYVKFGDLPTRDSFDARGVRLNSANQAISLAATRGGDYYVMVYGATVPEQETFTLTARLAGLSISGVGPARGSNTGQVTLSIAGAQFDAGTQPRLVDSAGNLLLPTRVTFVDSGLIAATFDLTGRPFGLADVQLVSAAGVTVTRNDGFEIVAGRAGQLVTNVIVPRFRRADRDVTVMVEYGNDGDTDILAPIMRVVSVSSPVGNYLLSLYPDRRDAALGVDVIGVAPGAPAGILPPGARGRILLYSRTPLNGGSTTFRVVVGGYSATPIDWDAVEDVARPEGFTDAEWQPLFARLQSNIGATWADFHRTVAQDATLLPPEAGLNYSLADVLQLEFQKAMADLATSVSGRIFLGDRDHPQGNVEIELFDPITQNAAHAVSLQDGSFVVPALGPGTYQVSLPGFLPLTPLQIEVGETDVTGLEVVVVPAGSIRGVVVLDPNGAPVRLAEVSATNERGQVFTTESDDAGRYQLDTLPAGTYRVAVQRDGIAAAVVAGIQLTTGQVLSGVNLAAEMGCGIRGVVRNAAGVPLAGVLVIANHTDDTVFSESATTAADGTFVLANLKAGSYQLVAVLNGFDRSRREGVTVAAGTDSTNIQLTLNASGSVSGTATNRLTGSPAAFAVVVLRLGEEVVASGHAGVDGVYSIADAPPGTWSISTLADGFLEHTGTLTVVAGQLAVFSPALQPAGTLSGTARDAGGQPLANVLVAAYLDGNRQAGILTEADGSWRLGNLPLGAYTISVGTLANRAGSVNRTLTVDEPAATADLMLPTAGRVSGRVLAADGTTTLAGVAVRIFRDGQEIASTLSAPDGSYSFLILSPGEYTLAAKAAARAFPLRSGVEIDNGNHLTGIDFIAGTAQLRGTVRDAAGQPVAGVSVFVADRSLGLGATLRFGGETAADGSFQLDGLAAGNVDVMLMDGNHASIFAQVSVPAGNGVVVSQDFTAATGTVLQGRVRDARFGRPIADAQVKVFDGTTFDLRGTASVDAEGRYVFPGLAAGTYHVVVAAEDFLQKLVENVVVAAGGSTLDVALDAPLTEVRIQTVPGAAVTLTDASGMFSATFFSDANGFVAGKSLPPGEYTAVTTAPGLTFSAPNVLPLLPNGVTEFSPPSAEVVIDVGTGPRPTPPPAVPSDGQSFVQRVGAIQLPQPPFTLQASLECLRLFREAQQQYQLAERAREAIKELRDADIGIGRAVAIDLLLRIKIVTDFIGLANGIRGAVPSTGRVLDRVLGQAPADPTTLREVFNLETNLNIVQSYLNLNDANRLFAEEFNPGEPPPARDFLGQLDGLNSFVSTYLRIATFFAGPSPFPRITGAPTVIGPLLAVAGIVNDFKAFFENSANKKQDIANLGTALRTATDTAFDARINFERLARQYNQCLAEKKLRPFGGALGLTGANEGFGTPFQFGAPILLLGASGTTATALAFDPNDKVGPAGVGTAGFIQSAVLPFTVQFENDPDAGATAAAQIVTVTDVLDEDLDLASVEFTQFGFGAFAFDVPAGLSRYETTLDLRPDGINLLVPVRLEVNGVTRVLTATFRSLDPDTGLPPDGIDDGFLPVNDATHRGEGFFSYTVRPLPNLPTGTEIRNLASIVFDTNDPIVTPETLNTLDVRAPTSSVNELPNRVESSTFVVSWNGSDDGSGIAFYDVFVSTDDGPFEPLLRSTPDTSTTFEGAAGRRYAFYVEATDHVGLREVSVVQAEATTATPPAVGNDAFAIAKDKRLTVVAPGVLANDRAADGGPLTVVLVLGPKQGKVKLNADGSFTYKPRLTAKGPDGLTYRVRDSEGAESEVATVSLLPSARFTRASLTQSEDVTTVKLPVKLSLVSTQIVTILYSVTAGTATSGEDYQLGSGVLTIPAGKAKGKIVFTVTNDRLDEPDETLQITLSSPTNALLGSPQSHTYTIRDNDAPAALLGNDALTEMAIALLMARPSPWEYRIT